MELFDEAICMYRKELFSKTMICDELENVTYLSSEEANQQYLSALLLEPFIDTPRLKFISKAVDHS